MYDSNGISQREWRLIITNRKDIETVSRDRIRQSLIEGVPPEYRGEIWCTLCEISKESKDHSDSIYYKLLDMDSP
jgi:hypothetical protein